MDPPHGRRTRLMSRIPPRSSFVEFPASPPNLPDDIMSASTSSSSSSSQQRVTPLKASSLLRGSVKLLAMGRLGIDPRDGTGGSSGVEEVTVSLSKSSFWTSPQSSSVFSMSPMPNHSSSPSEEEESPSSPHAHHQEESYDSFPITAPSHDNSHHHHHDDDEFRDGSSLDLARIEDEDGDEEDLFMDRTCMPESIPWSRKIRNFGDRLDEFMTAYTSQADVGLAVDHFVTPVRFNSKVKIKKLTLPSDLCIAHPGWRSTTTVPTTTSNIDPEQDLPCRKEQVFWDTIAASRIRTLGMDHHDTGEAFLSLGHAHLRLNEYDEAMEAFHTCCKIFEALDGPTHLSVGRALDAFGLAALRNYKGGTVYLIQAKTALEEAFAIRFHNLGVWHADTVETYNKIGNVYLHMGRLKEAADAYREVYLVRQAIYGNDHPSVAIIAHGLSNIHFNMRQYKEAQHYYNMAYKVYKSMNLSDRHPAIVRLRKDRDRLFDCSPSPS